MLHDVADDFPVAHPFVPVTTKERGSHSGFGGDPLGALELVAEMSRQVDVVDEWPDDLRWCVDVYLYGHPGTVGVHRGLIGWVLESPPPLVEPGDVSCWLAFDR